jgi:DNA-binding response OmpR family regulator
MENQRILIVDDDLNIAELVSLYLNKEFFDTKIVGDGNEAVATFESYKPDLVLLDLMLPGIDGYEVCRRIRMKSAVPIIIMSAKGETFDKVLGLELGADDYVMKPFDTKELVARIKAVLRRFTASETDSVHSPSADTDKTGEFVEYKGLLVNKTTYTTVYNGETLSLPPMEFELLYYLASHPNRLLSREQILDAVWGYGYSGESSRTVDVHVKRIREKIPGCEEWGISTVWGKGYKFEYHPKEARE